MRAKDRASKSMQRYATRFAFISRISSRRIFTSSCKASRNSSSASCHAWTSPSAAPPCSTAPFPRYPCHGSASSGRPTPGRHTPCGRCFTFVQHDRNTRSPLLSKEAERSRSRAAPASSAGRKTKGSPKALKRTSLSERSEFLFFNLRAARSRTDGAAGRLSSWYLLLSAERKKKYSITQTPLSRTYPIYGCTPPMPHRCPSRRW